MRSRDKVPRDPGRVTFGELESRDLPILSVAIRV